MAAPTVRTLSQILGELGTVYNPQIQSLQTRLDEIPGQIAAEEQGLAAKQETAFGDILSGARRRGTGVAFGGIPLQEQAKYTATEYLPSLARLKQSGREQAMTLQDAINQVRERQQTAAMAQRNYELQRRDAYDSEQRQLAAQRAAAAQAAQAADLSRYFDMGDQGGGASNIPKFTYDKKKGYTFYDAVGNRVSAAVYLGQRRDMGDTTTFRQLLQQMANKGDNNAKIALKYVGDDGLFGNVPSSALGALKAIGAKQTSWGKVLSASQPKKASTSTYSYNPNFTLGGTLGVGR